ncbi:hypothetical protein PIB30_096419 [Stylosanthes scabra]|uniref:Uncharacterized protein n=1 Tax=Stylosanthes scabra TaxID=79078 RepID=A0ABU6RVZ7_9FABA|nr:hypothetical protein [Stylosanthes scabra]
MLKAPDEAPKTVPCGRAVYCAVARSTKRAALTLYPRWRMRGPCDRGGLGRLHPELLPGTCEDTRGDCATARCPISLFLASSCDSYASNVFLSLLYAFLDP